MRSVAVSFVLLSSLLATGGCSKSKSPDQQTASAVAPTTPDAATPSDLPAQVDLMDGTHYTGVLVSKNGSQMTFRGDNGAMRTFDSRDIKSIRFGDSTGNAGVPSSSFAPSSSAASTPVEQAQRR